MVKKYKGLFITLEGIEGAGKSTHMNYIAGILRKSTGKKIVQTREPGGTLIGNKLRKILLHRKKEGQLDEITELLLMFAARQRHLDEIIKPALRAGKIVLCDRFTDSTYAYQGGGRKINKKIITQLANIVHPDIKPDLTLLFDVPVKLGIERATKRSRLDSFESEKKAFFERVRKTYLKIANSDAGRVKIIDARKDIKSVQTSIKNILESKKLC